jgi:hypothetical protein
MEEPNLMDSNIPESTQPIEQAEVNTESQSQEPEDLMSRVTQFKRDSLKSEANIKSDSETFDQSELAKITTAEEAKQWAESKAQSLEKGYQQKFQSLAEDRKNVEDLKSLSKDWSLDDIDALLKDPKFINAATQYENTNQTVNDDDYYASDVERENAQQINLLKQKMSEVEQEKASIRRDQLDSELSSKFKNYDPAKINQLEQDMNSGSVSATREHIYKAFFHDDNVKAAYEMGLRDRQDGITDKQELSSLNVGKTSPGIQAATPAPEENESGKSYFMRLAEKHLKARSSSQNR